MSHVLLSNTEEHFKSNLTQNARNSSSVYCSAYWFLMKPEGTDTFPNYRSWHVLWVTYTKCNFCWECQGERPRSHLTMCCAGKMHHLFSFQYEYGSSTAAVWADTVCPHKPVLLLLGEIWSLSLNGSTRQHFSLLIPCLSAWLLGQSL